MNFGTKLVATIVSSLHVGLSLLPVGSPLFATFTELLPLFWSCLHSSGLSTFFWHRNWGLGILTSTCSDLFSYCLDQNILVATFLKNLNNAEILFRSALLTSTSACQQLTSLLAIASLLPPSIPSSTQPDQITCNFKNGIFTSAFIYRFITLFHTIPSQLRLIWRLKLPPRVSTFIWLLLKDKLATIDNLQKRGMILVNCAGYVAGIEKPLFTFPTFVPSSPPPFSMYSTFFLSLTPHISQQWLPCSPRVLAQPPKTYLQSPATSSGGNDAPLSLETPQLHHFRCLIWLLTNEES